ncbi:substrate-binding domain-containing protein [[Haemophilus] felis]|uniref:Transcriptional regulator n=1 Tax=[Haemophilus] felis TaxID=123822 RepID=A0A1T0ASF9_9PAST|nr:LacI family DNA-binding transcriptional regulator [Gallibacterium anatis]NBI14064.1 substrate-binding domain-containing protein [[Haemophilus] felis]KGQ47134.1 sucrose operon repressor [Gallibacterium anatis 10672-6]NBI41799.1 substrate-binding domain-containing protein [[Haemophilus] felis]NBI43874.1 substrate-binding domain-containing protein [[Haemophilus] felis]OOR98861.1 transcriptional regulator [[Haemophilus] felis]
MTSLKDVAELAGVSLMTVSRALNNPEKLSQKTYEVVKKAIDELNYVPSLAAQSIRGSYAKKIGVLSFGTATTPFSVEILLGIEQTVRLSGWHSFVINCIENEKESLKHSVEALLAQRPNAIIIARNGLKKVKVPKALRHFPIVLANCVTNDIHVASYIPNDFQGQFELTELIIKQGYQRPLFLHIPHNYIATERRKSGFEKAWYSQEKVSEPVSFFMEADGEDYKQGAEPLMKILESNHTEFPFDVVICGNDRIAFVAYQLLLSKGFRIPEDVAVVGYDNTVGMSHLFIPSLTTVELPHYEMGKQAALHLIENRTHSDTCLLQCPLIIGKSC